MLELGKRTVQSNIIDEINDIGYAMVRPDGLQLGLDEEIIRRISDSGLVILKRKISVITPEQVDGLYPELHERSYYPPMKQALIGRKVMSLAIGGGASVGSTLLKIKGSAMHTSGSIRGDYSLGHLLSGDLHKNYIMGCLSEEQLHSPEWEPVMREDRMHSDETTAEAVNSINVMFEDYERAELLSRFPNLRNILLNS